LGLGQNTAAPADDGARGVALIDALHALEERFGFRVGAYSI
jgi:hypothetical protein